MFFYPVTVLRFNSQAPSFPQSIKTPPSFQVLMRTWQPNRTQAEQAAPGLLSAIQIFLKTHSKHRLRELELVLVNAAMMEIYFIRLLCWPIQTMQLSRCGASRKNVPWCLVQRTQHKELNHADFHQHGRRQRHAGDTPF